MRSWNPILPYNKIRLRVIFCFSNEMLIFFSFLLEPWKPCVIIEFLIIEPLEFFAKPIVLLEHHLSDSRNSKMDQLFPATSNPVAEPVFPWVNNQSSKILNFFLKIRNLFSSFSNFPLLDIFRHRIQTIGEEGSRIVFSMLPSGFSYSPLFRQ